MNAPAKDTPIFEVLLERLNKQRLPHVLSLQEKVDNGEQLNEFDIEFLTEAMHDLQTLKPYFDRNPDYQAICAKLTGVYVHIVEKGCENQTKAAK